MVTSLIIFRPKHILLDIVPGQIKWFEFETRLKLWLLIKPAARLYQTLSTLIFSHFFCFFYDLIISTVWDRFVLINLLQSVEQLFNFLSSHGNDFVPQVHVHVNRHSSQDDLILCEALSKVRVIAVEESFILFCYLFLLLEWA